MARMGFDTPTYSGDGHSYDDTQFGGYDSRLDPNDTYVDGSGNRQAKPGAMPAGTGAGDAVNRYRSLGEAAANRQAYQVNFGLANQDRQQGLQARETQKDAMMLQRDAAMGNAPSRAEIMGGQVAGQSLEASIGAGAGARPGGMAAAQMQAAQIQRGGQLAGQASAMGGRSQEIGQGIAGYGNTAGAIRGGDYAGMGLDQQQAEAQAQSENAQRQLNDQAQMHFEQRAFDVNNAELQRGLRQKNIYAQGYAHQVAKDQQNSDRNFKYYGAMTSAIGAGAGQAAGGRGGGGGGGDITSDARAKQEAYALGRAHQWEQMKTGKPVEWVGEKPKDIVDKDESRALENAPKREGVTVREHPQATAAQMPAPSLAQAAAAARQVYAPTSAPLPEVGGPGLATGYHVAQGIARGAVASDQGYQSSDKRTKANVHGGDEMTDALADGLAPHSWEYKPEYAAREGQADGERNVGIMAQNAEKNPITGTIVEQGEDGMRRINLKKSTSLALAAAGHNAQKLREQQAQIDALKGGR